MSPFFRVVLCEMTLHRAHFLISLVTICSLPCFSGCGRDASAVNPSQAAVLNQSAHGIATSQRPIASSATESGSHGLTSDQTRGQGARNVWPDSSSAQPSPVAEVPTDLTQSLQDTLPIPLAALGVNPELKLTPDQVSIMASIGDEFISDTAAPEPAHALKNFTKEDAMDQWQAAQEINDERFRAFFGDEVFNAQQVYRAQVEHDQLVQHKSSGASN